MIAHEKEYMAKALRRNEGAAMEMTLSFNLALMSFG